MRFTTLLKALISPVFLISLVRREKQIKHAKSSNIQIGFDCSIDNTKMGNHVYIGNGCSIVNTKIGGRSYLNVSTNIRNATIGKYCSIGSHVDIGIGIHPTTFVSTHPAFYSNNKAFETFADKMYVKEEAKIEIGNDVWIGSYAKIIGNINIGDGAIVALGAIVTKDVPPYSIVGGVPAKIIKYRFEKDKIDLLINLKWWDKDEKWIKENYKKFMSLDQFEALVNP